MEYVCYILTVAVGLMVTTTFGVRDVPEYKVEVLKGETSYLPCNVSTYDGDEVALVLWYREDKGTPIYSVDIRGGYSRAAKRWSDETVFGDRAYFMFDREPGKLSVQNTKISDSGLYRCRVDFLKAQTRNSRIKLTVIAPPDQIIIRDEFGVERSTVVGPYSEGAIMSLKCDVYGGIPIPKISWYRDGEKIMSQTDYNPEERQITSTITAGPLGRDDLNSRLTCKASNHPRGTPAEAAVQIDMNFPPLNIRLLGAHQPLSAGRRYDLLCQSAGSRPPAVITWWQNGIRLEKTTETTSSDGNQTTSTLSIILSKSDSGKYLSCKAHNHVVSSEPLEDGWTLDIQYIPEPYVKLGPSLDPNAIREGTDVYFDCIVLAHPPVFRIEWRHNGKPLPHNISHGVIISNHSLVLQGVTRAAAGNYSCVGYNPEGEGISPPFMLNILYSPTCVPNQSRIHGVAKQEDAKIKCTVDANPPEVEFNWTFNNSAESIDVATNHIERSGTSSIVTYTPITELDYGTLLCMATNKIGRQKVPCIFHIIAAGRPDQVHNCTLTNISMTSLTVTCSDGFNGGLPQLFILELKDLYTNEMRANITSNTPRFTVATLTPGSLYTLSIYAFNSKGRSDATTLNAAMLKMPEKQLTSEQAYKPHAEFLFSPVVSLTLGLTLAVMVAGMAVIIALRIPCNRSRRRQKEISNEITSRDGSPCPSEASSDSREFDGNESDDRNPDVVPESLDCDDQVDRIRRMQQHISTIDTATCHANKEPIVGTLVPAQQKFNATEMTVHTTHNVGYCSLRSGVVPISAPSESFTVNVAPHVYSKSIAQCTLPRYSGQHMWIGYSEANAPVRAKYIQPLSSAHQFQLPATIKIHNQIQKQNEQTLTTPPSFAVDQTSGSRNSPTGKKIPLQHLSQNQMKATTANKVNVELNSQSDEEATVQTPLMVKRESTV